MLRCLTFRTMKGAAIVVLMAVTLVLGRLA